MISYYQRTITTKTLKKFDDFKVGSWIHVEDPTEEELILLTEKFPLDRGLLMDAVDPYEVPRVELNDGVAYVFTRIPFEEGNDTATAPVLLGIAPEFVFSVTRKKLSFFDRFIEGRADVHTTQKTRFLITLLSEVDQAYARFITVINKEVRRTMGKLSSDIDNRDIVRFVQLETVLNDLLDALVPTNAALQKLLSGKLLTLYEEDKEFVEDVFLENAQLIELSRTNIRAIINIRNAYSTLMTNALNRTMKLLAALTVVFMVPTIMFNIYGMNVALPFAESTHAFLLVVILATMMTFGVLWIFRKKKLL
jgi:magnesium transporter